MYVYVCICIYVIFLLEFDLTNSRPVQTDLMKNNAFLLSLMRFQFCRSMEMSFPGWISQLANMMLMVMVNVKCKNLPKNKKQKKSWNIFLCNVHLTVKITAPLRKHYTVRVVEGGGGGVGGGYCMVYRLWLVASWHLGQRIQRFINHAQHQQHQQHHPQRWWW